MRLTWVVLTAATLLANFDSVFAIQDTDRATFRGAAVSLTATGTNNRFLRNGDFDEERGRLTRQNAEEMLGRMKIFAEAHLGVDRVAGLAELNREQVKLWFATSQKNVVYRQMKNDGMNPAKLSIAIGLDDIVKNVPKSKLMDNADYLLFQDFSRYWYKDSLKAKKLLPQAPSV